ncbi:hypothetical protein P7H17_18455 [Paenibacillus larvae]|nr:hypothetical protein [Paenibacillus larvae]MDT2287645.1 hypothetical protein [Paenibacillus larvae]
MSYVPKLNWKLDDTVTEKDFNRIEGGIKETLDKYKDVETTISELFTSVSNGKEQVAKAITDQGVPAVKEDPFKDLAAKIRSIDNGNIPIYVQPTEPTNKTGFGYRMSKMKLNMLCIQMFFLNLVNGQRGKTCQRREVV